MEMWGRWCQFDDDSAFRVRVVGISGHGRYWMPIERLGFCRSKAISVKHCWAVA
jgi:hypothetical protein